MHSIAEASIAEIKRDNRCPVILFVLRMLFLTQDAVCQVKVSDRYVAIMQPSTLTVEDAQRFND